MAMYSRKRKSCRDPNVIKESYSVKERIFAERREIRDFFELQGEIQAAHGEQAAPKKISEAEYDTGLLFEGQKNHLLSEARSEMSMRGLRGGSTDGSP